MSAKLLYSRVEAAELLGISISTLDCAIRRGMLRVQRKGRRVLVETAELDRFSHRDLPAIWPAKLNGKTVNSPIEARA